MSQLVKISTKLGDAECLINALHDCGCHEAKTGASLELEGYNNRTVAQIAVPRQSIATCADVGFRQEQDGTYSMVFDEDDKSKIKSRFARLNQNYQYHAIQKIIRIEAGENRKKVAKKINSAIAQQVKLHGFAVVGEIRTANTIKLKLRRWVK